MGARRSAARVRDFYATALTDAERLQLADARDVDGLDEEIALLRVRLRSALEERPQEFDLLRDGIALLVRAVATQYRLSPKARKDLADRMAAVLKASATRSCRRNARHEPATGVRRRADGAIFEQMYCS